MIARRLPRHITVEGRRYRVNLAFRRVLRFYELQDDTELEEADKLRLSARMLVPRLPARLAGPALLELQKLLQPENGRRKKQAGPKTVDFVQDAAYIYASFWQAYGINLNSRFLRLDWREFIALFQGLPEDTRMMKILDIRTRKIPKRTKHNSEYIQSLLRAKREYALQTNEAQQERDFQQGLDSLFDKVYSMANKP